MQWGCTFLMNPVPLENKNMSHCMRGNSTQHYMFNSSLYSPKVLVFHREMVSSCSSWWAPLMLIQKLIKKQNSLKKKSKKRAGYQQTLWGVLAAFTVYNTNFLLSSNKVSAMSSVRFYDIAATFQEPINKDTGMLIPPLSSGLNASHVFQSLQTSALSEGGQSFLCSMSFYKSHYSYIPHVSQTVSRLSKKHSLELINA